MSYGLFSKPWAAFGYVGHKEKWVRVSEINGHLLVMEYFTPPNGTNILGAAQMSN